MIIAYYIYLKYVAALLCETAMYQKSHKLKNTVLVCMNEILLKLVKQSRFSLKLCVKEVPEVGIKYSMHDQPF